jgi:chorismate mutase
MAPALAMTINDRRSQIDDLDRQLLELLNRRTCLAIEIGRLKAGMGLRALDPVRERAILSRAREANQGPLDGQAVDRIFRLILSESRRAAARALAEDAPPCLDATATPTPGSIAMPGVIATPGAIGAPGATPGGIAAPGGTGLSGGMPASGVTRPPIQTPSPRKEADHAT